MMRNSNVRSLPLRVILVLLALALSGAGLEGGPSDENEERPAGELIYESPVFIGSGEEYRPKPEMEKEGKVYRLVSSELRKAVKEGRQKFVSSWIAFTLEGEWEPPKEAEIMVTDEDTGVEKEYTVPILETKETGREWSSDFSFSITVAGYGAETFWLGDTEISGDAPLSQCGPELLQYLGLPEDCYQVDTVEWTGEPYEKDGVLHRDAQAGGRKLVRNLEVRYGGQVELPPAEGMKYYCVYREILEEEEDGREETTETLTQDGSASQDMETTFSEDTEMNRETPADGSGSLADRIFRWLMEHLTIVRVGAVFLAGIIFTVLLLTLSGRKKRGDGK